jgi:hypothetical protein
MMVSLFGFENRRSVTVNENPHTIRVSGGDARRKMLILCDVRAGRSIQMEE